MIKKPLRHNAFPFNHDDSKEALSEIQTSDSNQSNSSDEEVTLCPKNSNVNTKDQS